MERRLCNETSKGITVNMEDASGRKDRIGKRMAYLLRYGALKEGLHVDTEGACFVVFHKVTHDSLSHPIQDPISTLGGEDSIRQQSYKEICLLMQRCLGG